ncbi:hypothetical protein SK128_016735 [Halocaridina rubra]|uniref:Uncharacterized protein n=1 Tax=Halocaridina rubra TaxID=373956 RepID=A0AAN8ZY83_HALRR
MYNALQSQVLAPQPPRIVKVHLKKKGTQPHPPAHDVKEFLKVPLKKKGTQPRPPSNGTKEYLKVHLKNKGTQGPPKSKGTKEYLKFHFQKKGKQGPPPSHGVKENLKESVIANPLVGSSLKDDDGQKRNANWATPKIRRARRTTRHIPNSVKKAFSAKNRLTIPNTTESPQHKLILNSPTHLADGCISSPQSTLLSPPPSASQKNALLPTRNNSSHPKKVKRNFSDLFRRIARALRRAIPSEEQSFSGDQLV